jgi:hypothetical protein
MTLTLFNDNGSSAWAIAMPVVSNGTGDGN